MKLGTLLSIIDWLGRTWRIGLLWMFLLVIVSFTIFATAYGYDYGYDIHIEYRLRQARAERSQFHFEACEEQLGAWGHKYIDPTRVYGDDWLP